MKKAAFILVIVYYILAPYWEAKKDGAEENVTIDPTSDDSEKEDYTFTFGEDN